MKAADDIRSRDLDWTVLRPGGLTMESGTGLVRLTEPVDRGQVAREDVAAGCWVLDEPRTGGLSLDLVGGDTLITKAGRRAGHVVAGVAGPDAPSAR